MRFVLASLFTLSAFAAAPSGLLDHIPVRFELNPTAASAAPARQGIVRWSARGAGYAYLFTDDSTLLRVDQRTIRLTFPGANRRAHFEPADRLPGQTNFFIGKTRASVPTFRRLARKEIYPGIDVVYYGTGREIEYDFTIAPGADPSRIRMRFDGADSIRLNDRGEIVLGVGAGEVTQRAPVVYQRRASGEVVAVAAAYRMDDDGTARLKLGDYDRAGALVVDPTIAYAAYLSGTSQDTAVGVGHDAQGNLYLAGNTFSTDFPLTADAEQAANKGGEDIWLMKVNPSGGDSAIVYTTYLGGSGNDDVAALAVDSNGVMYVTGSTSSTDFPVSSGAAQSTVAANTHVFVAAVDPSQAGGAGLIYSTYLGGTNNEQGQGIAVAKGKIYVTGFTSSSDFPMAASFQSTLAGSQNAFAAEIDPSQSGAASLVASTFLGGQYNDFGRAIAVDPSGLVYIAGVTYSPNFPTTANALQIAYRGDGDAFLAKLDFGAATLDYSTLLGGSSIDEVKRIAIDPAGKVALAGYTLSPDYPVTANAYQTAFGGNGNAFLTIVDVTNSKMTYSSYFGGSGGEVAYGLGLDASGRYYLGGYTLSSNLPVTPDAINASSAAGNVDGFLAVLDPAAGTNGLVYGSYITGAGAQSVNDVDVQSTGSGVQVNLAGTTTSNVFPQAAPANQDPGKSSGFVWSLQFSAPASNQNTLSMRLRNLDRTRALQ